MKYVNNSLKLWPVNVDVNGSSKVNFFQILIMLLFINANVYQIYPLFAACSSPATLKMICRGRDS